MSEQQEIRQLVTAVFRAWQQAGINCVVLRNYQGLPESGTNGIEVLIDPSQLRQAEEALLGAASEAGFRLHNRVEFAAVAFYMSSKESNAQVHFDLFTALEWRGFEFLDGEEFLRRKLAWNFVSIPAPAGETALKLLTSLIHTGRVGEQHRASVAAGLKAEPVAISELLARTYGLANAKFVVAAGAQGRWAEIEAAAGNLRRALVVRQLTYHPWRTLKSLLQNAGRLTRRFIWPPGVSVVLCGADGSGKSTAASAVTAGLQVTFGSQRVHHFHWKPPLLSARRQTARSPITDPHGQPVRNPVVSLAYFGFHWLEFFLGSYLRLRPITCGGGLVLIDRFYYDFFVDQRRYRLRVPQFVVRLGHCVLPRPDLVVLLDAPAAVLQSRKQEVALAETESQRAAYLELVRRLRNGRVVDTTQPPEKVGAAISRAILDFMAERTRRRWSVSHP